jgi:flagellar hook-associated protein 2
MGHFNEFRTKNTTHTVANSIVDPSNQAWVTMVSEARHMGGPSNGNIKVTGTNSANVGQIDMEVVSVATRASVRGGAQFRGAVAANLANEPAVDLNSRNILSTISSGSNAGVITINDVNISITSADSINDIMTRVNRSNAGVTMSFDNLFGRFTITQNATGEERQIKTGGTGLGADLLNFMGLNHVNTDPNPSATVVSGNALVWDLDADFASLSYTDPSGTITINGNVITIGDNETMQEIMDKINAINGISVEYEGVRFRISADNGAQITISGENLGEAVLDSIGLNNISTPVSTAIVADVGRDASIFYRGFVGSSQGGLLKQASNVFELDGLRIDISEARGEDTAAGTSGQRFSINTTRNTDAAVDMIREFVENYNNLIRQLNALHTTARPRAGNSRRGAFFEPLTDEQRQAMSDRDIERWEEQARVGLLHRDSDIRNIQRQLRDLVFEPVTLNEGGHMSLHQLGIQTVGINGASGDRLIGVLEINEERLRRALDENPDAVRQVFARNHIEANNTFELNGDETADGSRKRIQMSLTNERLRAANVPYLGIAFRLDELLNVTSNSPDSPLRQRAGVAAGIDSSENMMSRQIQEYNRRIDQMQALLLRRENHYYSMFARMEQAMAQSNAQMDSLFAFAGM